MKKQLSEIKLLTIFFAVRILSFYFTPKTPLLAQHPINTLLTALIFILAVYWLIKKDIRGWYIVLLEIILGGSGGFLRLYFISLRTALLITSLTIFFIQKLIDEKYNIVKKTKRTSYFILILIITAFISAIRGLYLGHERSAVISDFIPYLFLLYYFPLRDLWKVENFRNFTKKAIFSTIIGEAIIILFTQIGLSSGVFSLQDKYYHWYRDVALGKITDLNFHFYRLVLNEHLLIIPLIIYFINDIIKQKTNVTNTTALFCLIFILANNLTRIYMVALIFGMLFSFTFKNWKRWIAVSSTCIILFFLIFTTTHTLASKGESLGLEIFGLRLQSIASPKIEESSMSRLLLFPKILEKIENKPILGEGLGDTVTAYSPIFKTNITTPHFDWGYLEILAEMGLVGFIAWACFILYIIRNKIFNNYKYNQTASAILVSFLVINLTSPALFHVFGFLLLTTIIISSKKKHALI